MFTDNILIQSQLFEIWFWWLILINSISALFVFARREARWILAVWLLHLWSLVFYEFIWEQIGYARFIGLSQIVLWTPLLIYLALRTRQIPWASASGRYIAVLMLSNMIALILDYRTFILWLLGEHAAQL